MEFINVYFFAYCLLGIAAGLIGGALGLGGGIVIVPALYFLFSWQNLPADIIMQMAVSTSLATIVFTSLSASYAHHKREAVLWQTTWMLIPGIFVGAIIGANIADALPSDTLRISFGIFEILVAIQIGFHLRPKAQHSLPERGGLFVTGTLIGSLSTILGIGGGTITVPFLLWCNVSIRHAVGTSSACGLPIALVGVVSMIIIGWSHEELPKLSLGYVYLPAALGITITSMLFAPIGAKIAHSLPTPTLQKMFAVIALIAGLNILS